MTKNINDEKMAKLRAQHKDLFPDDIMADHDSIIASNPDLHQGKAVGYDGKLNQSPRIDTIDKRRFRDIESFQYLPDDIKDSIIADSSNL